MSKFRRSWFDVGVVLGGILVVVWLILRPDFSTVQLILWLSLLTLFLHQFEEWRWPGWFAGMLNIGLFRSDDPSRYPLNSTSGMVVNVVVGWGGYVLAALLWSHALWLGVATLMVSIGNCMFHLVFMPLRLKIPYNPGMVTSFFLFLPTVIWFFVASSHDGLLTSGDLFIGIPLGIILNIVGVIGVIELLKREDAEPFPERMIAPARKRLLDR